MQALRQRNGEYEGDKLAAIQAQGGSEIYMMLTESAEALSLGYVTYC